MSPIDPQHPCRTRLDVLRDGSVERAVQMLNAHHLGDNHSCIIDGNRKSDFLSTRSNRDVDPDHFAVHIDQWTTAIAGVNRGIGLDQVFVRNCIVCFDVTTQCADVTECDSAVVAECVTNRDDLLAVHQIR